MDYLPITVGIVGIGDGGMAHIRAMQGSDKFRVMAVCDSDPAVLPRQSAAVGSPVLCFSSLEAMLAMGGLLPELVIIATPDDGHLLPARVALKAGCHVFVEKPLATTVPAIMGFKELDAQYKGRLHFGEKYSHAFPIMAALQYRGELGAFLWGNTTYTMSNCDRIMGGGKWRTEHAYNPAAGGLSHNFMTALLFAESKIVAVQAVGRVLHYMELVRHDGYDTMQGMVRFANDRFLQFTVCLATPGPVSPFGHRTVAHTFQFERGGLVYAPDPRGDELYMLGNDGVPQYINFNIEPDKPAVWPGYNQSLFRAMHDQLWRTVRDGQQPLHTVDHGINVALACAAVFLSAQKGGEWICLDHLV